MKTIEIVVEETKQLGHLCTSIAIFLAGRRVYKTKNKFATRDIAIVLANRWLRHKGIRYMINDKLELYTPNVKIREIWI